MDEFSQEASRAAWETNAEFWDEQMGDESNRFHREVVRPKVTELLDPQPGDRVLDIACGNGNYSAYMAERGASVVAFDYSPRMIELAKKRQHRYADRIDFRVASAADEAALRALGTGFDKAVSNMAIMDISDVTKLFPCVYNALKPGGAFVFATQHPCFVTLTDRYLTPHSYHDIAIEGQPVKQCYYHRSIQEIFGLCFDSGFVIDGFYETAYGVKEKPDVIIVRARKL